MLPAVVTGRPSASGAVTVAAEVGPDPGAVPGRSHRVRPWLMAGAAYLALAVFLWWGTWSTHPTSTTICGCGDASLFTWFLEWPAYAMAHGLDPWYSAAIFHPTGINLLSNTGEVLVGVGLAPVTWLFGPVAALNVALTLSPALSALAMFALLRRWVAWAPAAFVGGLLYGFSPLALKIAVSSSATHPSRIGLGSISGALTPAGRIWKRMCGEPSAPRWPSTVPAITCTPATRGCR